MTIVFKHNCQFIIINSYYDSNDNLTCNIILAVGITCAMSVLLLLMCTGLMATEALVGVEHTSDSPPLLCIFGLPNILANTVDKLAVCQQGQGSS